MKKSKEEEQKEHRAEKNMYASFNDVWTLFVQCVGMAMENLQGE